MLNKSDLIIYQKYICPVKTSQKAYHIALIQRTSENKNQVVRIQPLKQLKVLIYDEWITDPRTKVGMIHKSQVRYVVKEKQLLHTPDGKSTIVSLNGNHLKQILLSATIKNSSQRFLSDEKSNDDLDSNELKNQSISRPSSERLQEIEEDIKENDSLNKEEGMEVEPKSSSDKDSSKEDERQGGLLYNDKIVIHKGYREDFVHFNDRFAAKFVYKKTILSDKKLRSGKNKPKILNRRKRNMMTDFDEILSDNFRETVKFRSSKLHKKIKVQKNLRLDQLSQPSLLSEDEFRGKDFNHLRCREDKNENISNFSKIVKKQIFVINYCKKMIRAYDIYFRTRKNQDNKNHEYENFTQKVYSMTLSSTNNQNPQKKQLIYHKILKIHFDFIGSDTLPEVLFRLEILILSNICKILAIFPLDDIRLIKSISYLKKPKNMGLENIEVSLRRLGNCLEYLNNIKQFIPLEFKQFYIQNLEEINLFLIKWCPQFEEIMLRSIGVDSSSRGEDRDEEEGNSNKNSSDILQAKLSLRKEDENSLWKVKHFCANIFISRLDELFGLKGSEINLKNVVVQLLKGLKFDKKFKIISKQSYLLMKFNIFLNKNLNQTQKRWNLFVDCCTEMLASTKILEIQEIMQDTDKMDHFCKVITRIQTGVAKGIYMGFIRISLSENVASNSNLDSLSKDMNKFMISLLENFESLPIFVFYARMMQKKFGDLHALAKNHKIQPLEIFAQRFMILEEKIDVEDFKIIFKDYGRYVKLYKKVNYFIKSHKFKEMESIISSFLGPVTVGGLKKKLTRKDRLEEQYLFSLVLINGIYIPHSVKSPDLSSTFITFFDEYHATVKENIRIDEEASNKNDQTDSKIPKRRYYFDALKRLQFYKSICQNFETFNGKDTTKSALSLKPGMSKDEIRLRITIVHTQSLLFSTSAKDLDYQKSSNGLPYHRKSQLAAYPGKTELKFLLIANTFQSLSSQWRTGQSFTKLYQCTCGFLYWIGDCGRAWVIAKCPQCHQSIGGEKHKLINSEIGSREITKDLFFNEIYNPCEESSKNLYQPRPITALDSYIREERINWEESEDKIISEQKKLKVQLIRKLEKEKLQLLEYTSGAEIEDKIVNSENLVQQNEQEMGMNEQHQHIQNQPQMQEIAQAEDTRTPINPDDIIKLSSSDSQEKYSITQEKPFTPLRTLESKGAFALADFLSHSRFLLEWIIGDDQQKMDLESFLGIKPNKCVDYLIKCQKFNYEIIQSDVKCIDNSDQFFMAINILLGGSLFFKINQYKNAPRNKIEGSINQIFGEQSPKMKDSVVNRIQIKKNFDNLFSSKTKLIQNWIKHMISLEDFKHEENDLKLISGMRIESKASQQDFQMFVKQKIQTKNSVEKGFSLMKKGAKMYEVINQSNDLEIKRLKFFKKIIELVPLLQKIGSIIWTHIDFVQYLTHNFEHRVTYHDACSIKIIDMLKGDIQNDNQMNQEISDKEEGGVRNNITTTTTTTITTSTSTHRIKELCKTFKEDPKFEQKFYSLKASWSEIESLRDQYSDLLNFRFLCHDGNMGSETLEQILNPHTSRLVYFLTNPEKPECKFMNSAIHTLSNIQNTLIKECRTQYRIANLREEYSLQVSQVKNDQLISMESDLNEILEMCSFTNLSFNKDLDVAFNLGNLEMELSNILFKGTVEINTKKLNFCFLNDFGILNSNLKTILQLKKNNESQLQKIQVARNFPKKFQNLISKNQNLSYFAISRLVNHYRNNSKINLPASIDGIEFSENEEKWLTELHVANLSFKHLNKYYSYLEQDAFQEEINRVVVEKGGDGRNGDENMVRFTFSEKPLLLKICSSLYMTQMHHKDISHIAGISLLDCIQWTDFVDIRQDQISEKLVKKVELTKLKMRDILTFVKLCLI